MGPPGAPLRTKWKFYIRGVGYQNRIKRVCGVHLWRNFWKIFKDEDFGLKIWDTQYKIVFFALIKTRTNCPYASTFLDIYIPLARLYIYIYLYKYIYTHIQIYIHIYLHVLLFNFLTTFSFRMLCLKKPYNMDFLK